MAVSKAFRRLAPLIISHPPPLASPSFQDSPSSSSSSSALVNSARPGRISRSRLFPSASSFHVYSCSSPYYDCQYGVVPGESLVPQVAAAEEERPSRRVVGAEARIEATKQVDSGHSTVSVSVLKHLGAVGNVHQLTAFNFPLLVSSGFSQRKRRIRVDRFHCMAAGGSKRGGGFVLSSVLKEASLAEEGFGRKGDALLLVTFETKHGQRAVGVARGDLLWSLQEVSRSTDGKPLPQITDMASVITNWNDLRDRLILEGSGTPLSEVKILAPIPRPTGVIMCIGKNYLDHVQEVDSWKSSPGICAPDAPKHPIVFTKAPQSVIGLGSAIKYPHGVSSAVDYEAELAVIIGKVGQNIKREDAMSHIFGYTIVNDVTARDLQKRHQQWFLGKSCDTFCPMGPGIVPASELDGNNLQIQCWINDELRQDGRTSQMIFGIAQLIEVISAATTLQPGDIIATGTPAGVGSGFNPPRHLAPGDKIRIRIEGIGELTNTVE